MIACSPFGAHFGNHAARVDPALRGSERATAHERAVLAYAAYLASPARAFLRNAIRRHLRGKYLVCHCARKGLACHAEVIAAWANECIPCSVLTAGAARRD